MPRIQSISIIRNEEDIVEMFVRHHAPILERMRITLHRSEDGTRKILERLRTEGIPLEIDSSDADGYPQSDVLTRLLHRAAEDAPDFIIVLDADEFLGGEDVRMSLEQLPQEAVTLLPWRTYVPGGDHRRDREEPQYSKLLIPGGIAGEIEHIETGAHSFAARREIAMSTFEDLHLKHLPVRSETQLRGKIIRAWESHLKSPNRKPGENYHWEALYTRCLDPSPMTDEELARIAAAYASHSKAETGLVYDPIRTPL